MFNNYVSLPEGIDKYVAATWVILQAIFRKYLTQTKEHRA